MKNFSRYVFLTSLTIYATGCSYIPDKYNFVQQRQTEYLRAQTSQPIRVPAGMSNASVHEDYPVPYAGTPAPKTAANISPPNSLAEQIDQGRLSSKALKQREAMLEQTQARNESEIKSATTDPTSEAYSGFKNDTLMINQPAGEAWPVVENAITKGGYKIALKNPQTQTFYILDVYSTNGTVAKETPIYQIHLRNTPLGTEVSVTDNRSRRLSLNDANRILDNIYSGLPKQRVRRSADNATVTRQGVTPNSNPTTNFGRLINSLIH